MNKDHVSVKPRRGGRPSREEAGQIEDKILDAAAALFFSEGYGTASIEKIARRAKISKRTFYARFDSKAAIFKAVVHRIIHRIRPAEGSATDQLFAGKNLKEILNRLSPIIVHAALTPEALSMQRIVMAEATRFPELALIMSQQGARQEAIKRIALLLQHEVKTKKLAISNASFAAEQFLSMLTAVPLRRALGLGVPMSTQELDAWTKNTIELFLNGCANNASST